MTNASVASLIVTAVLWVQPPVRGAAADALVQAKELYESANYEQALDVLNRLPALEIRTAQDQQTVRRYRVLCLFALDRSADAERVLEEMIRADPAVPPLSGDLSPRVQELVRAVRQRVAKVIIKETYEEGRVFYDREQYAEAADRLGKVMALFNDPSLGLTADGSLSDLRLLADGFLDLSQALAAAQRQSTRGMPAPANGQQLPRPGAAAAPPRSPAIAPSSPPSSPAVATSSPSQSPSPESTAGERPKSGPAPAFVPPKPIVQLFPPLEQAMTGYVSRREGLVEIEVGTDGSVLSATVKVPTIQAYDALLVATAKRDWKYEPATRLGVPTPYRLRIRYTVASR